MYLRNKRVRCALVVMLTLVVLTGLGVVVVLECDQYRLTRIVKDVEAAGGAVVSQSDWPQWMPEFIRGRWWRISIVDLSGCVVSDELMGDICLFSRARQLYLEDAAVGPAAFDYLGHMDNVVVLILNGCRFVDGDLERLVDKKTIKMLWMDGTGVDDDGLRFLCEMRSLEDVSLSNTEVTGRELGRLAGLQQLRSLRLSGCRIDGAGFAAIGQLKQLRELWVDLSEATDRDVAHLAGLTGLKRLKGGNGISDGRMKVLREKLRECEIER